MEPSPDDPLSQLGKCINKNCKANKENMIIDPVEIRYTREEMRSLPERRYPMTGRTILKLIAALALICLLLALRLGF